MLSLLLDFGGHSKKWLGTQVKLSTTFHPQMDSQAERTIQTLEYILRDCFIDYKTSGDEYFPLVEISYNNSYHFNIQMTLYEALMGESVDPQLAGSNQMTLPYLGQILYIKLWKKSK